LRAIRGVETTDTRLTRMHAPWLESSRVWNEESKTSASRDRASMSTFHDSSQAAQPYRDPTPLPDDIPKVEELGATSAPLKSAAFFIGAYCKDYNGVCTSGLDSQSSLNGIGWGKRISFSASRRIGIQNIV
jgi:hypothetical protein